MIRYFFLQEMRRSYKNACFVFIRFIIYSYDKNTFLYQRVAYLQIRMSEVNECINIWRSEHGIPCERFLAPPSQNSWIAECPNEIWTSRERLTVQCRAHLPDEIAILRKWTRVHPDEREPRVSGGMWSVCETAYGYPYVRTYASVVMYPQAWLCTGGLTYPRAFIFRGSSSFHHACFLPSAMPVVAAAMLQPV